MELYEVQDTCALLARMSGLHASLSMLPLSKHLIRVEEDTRKVFRSFLFISSFVHWVLKLSRSEGLGTQWKPESH